MYIQVLCLNLCLYLSLSLFFTFSFSFCVSLSLTRKYGSRLWRSGSVTTAITRTRRKNRNAFLPSTLTSKKTRCVCVCMHAHNQRLERCLTSVTSLPTSTSMHVRNYAWDDAYRYQTGSWMCANATGALLLKALEASGCLKTWRITTICCNPTFRPTFIYF